MQWLLNSTRVVIDTVFPPSDAARLIRDLPIDALTERHLPTGATGTRTLLPFHDSLVRAAVHEAKFHNSRHATRMLAEVLGTYICTYSRTYLVIPIPLSRARYRERGYNQVTEILKFALRDIPRAEIDDRVLRRTKNTKPQSELPREKRLQNVENAFVAKRTGRITGRHVLLIDDVMTTGATMRAARAELARHRPKSITCIALAH